MQHDESMTAGTGRGDSQLHELFARAQATREHSALLITQYQEMKQNSTEILELLLGSLERTRQITQSATPWQQQLRSP